MVTHLLKVALGKKRKSIARKRSNLAGEFSEVVTEEVTLAFAGEHPRGFGELWELSDSFLLTGSKKPGVTPAHMAHPSKLQSHRDRTPPHCKSAS